VTVIPFGKSGAELRLITNQVLESDQKFESLRLLSLEMDDLSERVAREQSRTPWQSQSPNTSQIFEELRKITIPA